MLRDDTMVRRPVERVWPSFRRSWSPPYSRHFLVTHFYFLMIPERGEGLSDLALAGSTDARALSILMHAMLVHCSSGFTAHRRIGRC